MRKLRKLRASPCDAEEFVRIWESAETFADVMAQMDRSVSAVASRASYLRRRGVPLKMFTRGLLLDITKLQKMCLKCGK